MKRTNWRLLPILLFLIISSSLSATDQAILTLSGTVPTLVEIVVKPNRELGLFDLTILQESLKVGQVEEWANVKNGYTVILESENARRAGNGVPRLMAESSQSDQALNYEVYYDGRRVIFDADGRAVVTETVTLSSATLLKKDVIISYDGTQADLDEDYYSDTLVFSISPK